ncbi:MAG TPA: hypothetical protein VHW91_05510 [Candidatus Dormibacteraeota bacterium]|nr:hypothetical protein [Candidatus Dormibacteraeota bacterium]
MASLARPATPFPTEPGTNRSIFHRASRWLDLPRLFLIAIFTTMLIAAIQPVTDPDFWWHLTTGNWMLSHQAIPHQDLFTFTVLGHRWITHEWLSEVVIALLYAAGRLPLVSLALGGVTAAGFLFVYLSIDRRVGFVIRGLVLALGVAAANPIWGPRIQMETFALSALTYLWVKRYCEGRSRALYALPLVMLVWVNLHAGFVIAYAIVGIALAVEGLRYLSHRTGAMPLPRLRTMALVLLASVGVAIINPNGWDIYLYPFQTGGSAEQQKLIVEWFSPNFQMSQIWAFEAMIFLILGSLALARRIEPRQFLLLLLGLGLALHSVRNLSFFMLVGVPALADYAQQAAERLQLRWPFRLPKTSGVTFALNSGILLVLALIVLLASAPSLLQRVDGKLIARDFPVKAADFLAQHPAPGHMLNVYGWGGYLIYRLDSRSTRAQPVFIFGDAALDGDQLLKDYSHLQSLGSDQAQLLDRYQINWVIFHSDDPIITELRQLRSTTGHPGWFELKTFDKATIMMRDTPENRAYAARALG